MQHSTAWDTTSLPSACTSDSVAAGAADLVAQLPKLDIQSWPEMKARCCLCTCLILLLLQVLQTSSPSYLLLASLDAARRHAAAPGTWDAPLAAAAAARAGLCAIKGLTLLQHGSCGSEGSVAGWDPLRLVANVSGLRLSGFAAAEWLEAQHSIVPELATAQVGEVGWAVLALLCWTVWHSSWLQWLRDSVHSGVTRIYNSLLLQAHQLPCNTLVVNVSGFALSGFAAAEWLEAQHSIVPELATAQVGERGKEGCTGLADCCTGCVNTANVELFDTAAWSTGSHALKRARCSILLNRARCSILLNRARCSILLQAHHCQSVPRLLNAGFGLGRYH
jgi:hypothetical protein